MNLLYPPIEPYAVHRLQVGPPHRIYVEQCGNPDGVPVVFLHGGPGSGCNPEHRRFFDPQRYRVVLFDQRGCGRSGPLGETAGNRTVELLDDLELVRMGLGIPRWLLFGGSWGATLALLYAQSYPAAVTGLVLRGTFLARERDLEWFFRDGGAGRLLPQAWEMFCREIPAEERGNLIEAYHRRIHGPEAGLALAAARAWAAWTDAVVTWTLPPAPESGRRDEDAGRVLAKSRIESHYARYRYFIEDNQILARAGRLPAVPVSLVHGSRDLTCPLEAAWLLHRKIPGSKLSVVPDAGHVASEPAMVDALLRETDRFGRCLFGPRR